MAPFLWSGRERKRAPIRRTGTGVGFLQKGTGEHHERLHNKQSRTSSNPRITSHLRCARSWTRLEQNPLMKRARPPEDPSWIDSAAALPGTTTPGSACRDRDSPQALDSGFGPMVAIHSWLLDPGLPAIGPDHFERIERCQFTDSKMNGSCMLRRE